MDINLELWDVWKFLRLNLKLIIYGDVGAAFEVGPHFLGACTVGVQGKSRPFSFLII